MKSQIENVCPACGSSNIEEHKTKDQISMPFVGTTTFDIVENRCNECGEEGDFFGQNGNATAQAVAELNKKSAIDIMEFLTSTGRQMAYMERAFRLPQRTMMRWKRGECTSADLALLRLLRTFPALVEVADEKFSKEAAERFVWTEAQNLRASTVKLKGWQIIGSPKNLAYQAIVSEATEPRAKRPVGIVMGSSAKNATGLQKFEPKIGNLK